MLDTKKIFIAIIDDNPKNLQVLGTILRNEGYGVLAINDSNKAIKAIEKQKPDLILLDILMPDINGIDLCKSLKENKKTSDIPVIFITAKVETEDILKGFNAGAVDYITKPFKSEELLVRVSNQIKLKQAIQDANHSNKIKSQFLANMSHDIRTPINAILGMLELVIGTQLNDEQINYIKMAQRAGSSLLCLINDILDFSKIEAGQLTLEKINFNLIDVIEESIDLFCIQAYEKELDLELFIDHNLIYSHIGDPFRIKQILVNLISNAIKFTAKGSISILAKNIDNTQNNNIIEITVKDTGIGIAKDKLDNLFHFFSQTDPSITRKYGGTGLGLAISKKLINIMGGDIDVLSTEKKGSSFIFTLNLEKQETQIEKKSFNDLNILILDPNEVSRQALESKLKFLQCFYTSCNEFSKIIKQVDDSINEKSYDAIFIDKNIVDTINDQIVNIKNDPKFNNIKFIMIANIRNKNSKELSKQNLFDSVIQKPFKLKQLIDCMDKISGNKPFELEKNYKSDISNNNKNNENLNLKILIIDDDEMNRIVASEMLIKKGYEVDIAGEAKQALSLLLKKKYDILFMDVQMPEISGIELTKIIRNNEFNKINKYVYIIAITALAMKEDKDECLKAGMNDFVTKPFSGNDLINAIKIFNNSKVCVCTESKVNKTYEIFNVNTLFKRVKSVKSLIIPLIESAFDNYDALLENLKKAYKDNNNKDIIFYSHTLKGHFANIEAQCLANLFLTIEKKGKDNKKIDFEIFKDIEIEYNKLISEIEKFKSSSLYKELINK